MNDNEGGLTLRDGDECRDDGMESWEQWGAIGVRGAVDTGTIYVAQTINFIDVRVFA
jgi:hypothetical protein